MQESSTATGGSGIMALASYWSKLVLCVVVVRWFWYEWRPWHVLSLKREVLLWGMSLLLYWTIQRHSSIRPLRYYGKWALVDEELASKFEPALQSRGLHVAVLCPSSKEKEGPTTSKQSIHCTTTPQELARWLGKQQWNGGVGIYITSSSTRSTDDYDCVKQVHDHMAFRSSGAIVIVGIGESSLDSEGVVMLKVPSYLYNSSGLAEATLKALGLSKRLQLHHVLLQQVKELSAVFWMRREGEVQRM